VSVIHLSADELGIFTARLVKIAKLGFKEALELAATASQANTLCFRYQYGKNHPDTAFAPWSTEDDIEPHALKALAAGEPAYMSSHPGVAYNIYANDGTAFIDEAFLKELSVYEEAADKIAEEWNRKQSQLEKKVESFDDCPKCPVWTKEEIEAEMKRRGCARVIIAEYWHDESDSQSDYFGGSKSRTVVIGFGKGKRESFAQLRKAAAEFPPTTHMGPGKGRFTCCVQFDEDWTDKGNRYWKGQYAPWFTDIGAGKVFETMEEAQAFCNAAEIPAMRSYEGVDAKLTWMVSGKSPENRENYSMGGGNYLGFGRYSRWRVSSTYGVGDCEVFVGCTPRPQPKPSRQLESIAADW
jgi:hypothetical protein